LSRTRRRSRHTSRPSTAGACKRSTSTPATRCALARPLPHVHQRDADGTMPRFPHQIWVSCLPEKRGGRAPARHPARAFHARPVPKVFGEPAARPDQQRLFAQLPDARAHGEPIPSAAAAARPRALGRAGPAPQGRALGRGARLACATTQWLNWQGPSPRGKCVVGSATAT